MDGIIIEKAEGSRKRVFSLAFFLHTPCFPLQKEKASTTPPSSSPSGHKVAKKLGKGRDGSSEFRVCERYKVAHLSLLRQRTHRTDRPYSRIQKPLGGSEIGFREPIVVVSCFNKAFDTHSGYPKTRILDTPTTIFCREKKLL